jgi:hypothetical protein
VEFTFAVTRDSPDVWVLQLIPMGPGQPVMEMRFGSKSDCEQAIEMIREAPVRYVRYASLLGEDHVTAPPPATPSA